MLRRKKRISMEEGERKMRALRYKCSERNKMLSLEKTRIGHSEESLGALKALTSNNTSFTQGPQYASGLENELSLLSSCEKDVTRAMTRKFEVFKPREALRRRTKSASNSQYIERGRRFDHLLNTVYDEIQKGHDSKAKTERRRPSRPDFSASFNGGVKEKQLSGYKTLKKQPNLDDTTPTTMDPEYRIIHTRKKALSGHPITHPENKHERGEFFRSGLPDKKIIKG